MGGRLRGARGQNLSILPEFGQFFRCCAGLSACTQQLTDLIYWLKNQINFPPPTTERLKFVTALAAPFAIRMESIYGQVVEEANGVVIS